MDLISLGLGSSMIFHYLFQRTLKYRITYPDSYGNVNLYKLNIFGNDIGQFITSIYTRWMFGRTLTEDITVKSFPSLTKFPLITGHLIGDFFIFLHIMINFSINRAEHLDNIERNFIKVISFIMSALIVCLCYT